MRVLLTVTSKLYESGLQFERLTVYKDSVLQPTLAKVMSPRRYENSMKADVPLWTGEEPNPWIWDDFRFALQGYCGERGLSYLIRDEVKTEEVNDADNDMLMSIILRFTRGQAGKIVRPFAKKGDGASAWRALIVHYGNECKDRRQTRIIECSKMLEKIACRGKEEISSMVVELDHVFREFKELDCPYPDELKKVTLLTKLQPVAGEIYGCVIKDANTTYEETAASVRKMAAFDSAVDRANKRVEPEFGAYHSSTVRYYNDGDRKTLVTAQEKGAGGRKMFQKKFQKRGAWKPARDQCLWCLGKGHMYRVCPEKKRGLPSRIRPDGSRFEDHTGKSEGGTGNLAAQCLLSYVEPNYEMVGRKWLIDSGCNRHMTPHREDLIDVSDDNTVCRFGNGEKTEAKGQGNVILNCKDEKGIRTANARSMYKALEGPGTPIEISVSLQRIWNSI